MNMICAQPRSVASHSPEGTSKATVARAIANCADQALLAELILTPRLEDRRNYGASRDRDLRAPLASSRAIAPLWPRFVEVGYASAHIAAQASLPLVRPTGVLCEQAML